MRKFVLLGLVALIGVLAVTTVALADRGRGKGKNNATSFATRLIGWEEVPAQVTTGKGSFKLDTSSVPWRFTLRYQEMEGPVFMAHIHISSRHENGGISAWLCGASAVGTPAEMVCPAGQTAEGVVVGTIETADITGPTGQGVEPGNFVELLRALRKGETYTNVHTGGTPVQRAPGGEIRGQNRPQKNHDDDDD